MNMVSLERRAPAFLGLSVKNYEWNQGVAGEENPNSNAIGSGAIWRKIIGVASLASLVLVSLSGIRFVNVREGNDSNHSSSTGIAKLEADDFSLRVSAISNHTPLAPESDSVALAEEHRAPTASGRPSAFVPACGRDVFLTLREEASGEDNGCRGLLVTDGIIITSRECSGLRFTSRLAGVGVIRAIPHATLNSREAMANSSIGFLQTQLPAHYIFAGSTAPRTMMFLSRRHHSGAAMTCVNDSKPVAHGFPIDPGSMVSFKTLSSVLPDEVLWEEIDIDAAPALGRGGLRWWTRRITLEEEEERIRELTEEYRGPKGSVSIPRPDAHSENIAQGTLFEAFDPRGHRYTNGCYEGYYVRYREEDPFSGTHFFDWLDFGHGRSTIGDMRGHHNHSCRLEDFDAQTVVYLDDEERDACRVNIVPFADGRRVVAQYARDGAPVPRGKHIYMWDTNGTFYVAEGGLARARGRSGILKHSSILAGRPALSGGRVYLGKDGSLTGIDYSSGHYRPGIRAAALMHRWFKDRGLNVSAVHWVREDGWSAKLCAGKKGADWEQIEILGYDSAELKQSCYEVTASPMWVNKTMLKAAMHENL